MKKDKDELLLKLKETLEAIKETCCYCSVTISYEEMCELISEIDKALYINE
jgi:hypothetical protein